MEPQNTMIAMTKLTAPKGAFFYGNSGVKSITVFFIPFSFAIFLVLFIEATHSCLNFFASPVSFSFTIFPPTTSFIIVCIFLAVNNAFYLIQGYSSIYRVKFKPMPYHTGGMKPKGKKKKKKGGKK